MSTWFPPIPTPPLIHHRRFTRNGQAPQAAYYKRVADAQNHVVAYRRKWIASWSQPLNNLATRVATAGLPVWRTYFHSGHGVLKINVNLVLGTAYGAAGPATAPEVYAQLKNPTTGAVVCTSAVVACTHSASTAVGPDTWAMAELSLPASDDTDYWLQLYTSDFARIISAEAHEVPKLPVNDAVTGAVDPRYSVGSPIWDGAMSDLAANQTELLRSNRRHLISWSIYDGVSAITNATDAILNVIDGTSTAWSETTNPGFYIQNQYCNTYGRTLVPCVLAVYGENTVHSADSSFRLYYAAGSYVEVTGIGDALGWYTAAVQVPVAAAKKFDPVSLNGASSTVRIDAVALLEYE